MSFPRQCCASGSLHTGTPTGRIDKLHGLDVYIAEPTGKPKGIVVILPDIFGWTLPNSRILADKLAKKGEFLVYLPDFMNGNVFPPDLIISIRALDATGPFAFLTKLFHFAKLLSRGGPFLYNDRAASVRPRVLSFFRSLPTSHPDLPVGAAGYCWGGQWVVELCSNRHSTTPPTNTTAAEPQGRSGGHGTPLIACGFTAHPSRVAIPKDFEAVQIPLSVAASEHDQHIPPPKSRLIKEVLAAKTAEGKDDGVEHEYVLYAGTHHGFAVRADEKDKVEAESGERAEDQAVKWFQKWFA